MRIVNREQFLKLPAGTLFSKYEPTIFGDLSIKDDTCDGVDDFFYISIADAVDANGTEGFVDTLDRAEKEGSSFSLDLETVSRDGLFDKGQLFAVWESQDVNMLIARLQAAKALIEEHGKQ
jgi:hypothetical protein